MTLTEIATPVLCNGLPKSGTHALEKAVQLLGQTTELAHIPFADRRDGAQLLVKRNPRNIVISWLRHRGSPITEGSIIHAIKAYDGEGVAARHAAYSGYLTTDDVLVVQFERLLSDENELMRIAEHIGCAYLSDAFDHIPGLTVTWTGELSNWVDHWTDRIDNEWVAAGGLEVEAEWSY